MNQLINKFRKIICIVGFAIIFICVGCITETEKINIINGEFVELKIGESKQLEYTKTDGIIGDVVWESSSDCVIVSNNGLITAYDIGTSIVTVTIDQYYAIIIIEVVEDKFILEIFCDRLEINIGEKTLLSSNIVEPNTIKNIEYFITNGSEYARINGNEITGVSEGQVTIVAKCNGNRSNTITINIVSPINLEKIQLIATDYELIGNEISTLNVKTFPESVHVNVEYEILSGKELINFNEKTKVVSINEHSSYTGEVTIIAKCCNIISNIITINIIHEVIKPISITLIINKDKIDVGDYGILSYELYPSDSTGDIIYEVIRGKDCVEIIGNNVHVIKTGEVMIIGLIDEIESNTITINSQIITSDPYINVNRSEFYNDYSPATNYIDSYYRTLHNLMSGSIDEQNQEPFEASYKPKRDGYYIRNTYSKYCDDGKSYCIYDSYGNLVSKVYKGGAYVLLEEVAAYIFAFGNVPANYIENKSGKPSKSDWKEFLRLNHSYFSGDTNQYPYEPILPNINGCGGELFYYELDIGTTGTDCDSNYPTEIYNNGNSITRGAARIVYTRFDKNGDEIIDINEKYLFYTYNHYNDFQEYLNYYGGWGEKFGNITGGGEISSTYNYNPTNYVPVIKENLFDMNESLLDCIIDDYYYYTMIYLYKKDEYELIYY